MKVKNNLAYYHHRVDSHNHWKFKTLRRKYGWEGEGKFWALNNMIAQSEGCQLDIGDETRKNATAVELDFDVFEFEKYVDYVVNNCRLLEMSTLVLTSKITQENLEEVNERRDYQREWKKKKSTSKPDNSNIERDESSIETPDSNIENGQRKGKEIKGNKNKGKERRNTAPPPSLEIEKKEKKIQKPISERRQKFQDDVQNFGQQFELRILQSFFDWWSQVDEGKTSMRFEAHKNFDIAEKLRTWQETEWPKIYEKSLNGRPPPPTSTLEDLYQRFLEGKFQKRMITEEHFEELKLQLDDDTLHRAKIERINQLIGSNHHSDMQLIEHYQTGKTSNLITMDEPTLKKLAKRLSVIDWLQKYKSESNDKKTTA